MQTIGIADMMADYIISHKGEEYKIDLGEWDFYKISWIWETLDFYESFDNGSMVANTPIEKPTIKKVKDLILIELWVED